MEIVVILGCKLTDDCTGREIVGRSTLAASFLIGHEDILVVASGGKTEPICNKSEAQVILDTLLKYGLDSSRIILEERSRSTIGNAFFTKNILSELGVCPSKLYLVTSCYHARRAEMIFSRFFDCPILSSICFSYTRTDEMESKKYIRDMDIIQSMGDLNNRESIIRDFSEWL